MLKLLNKNLRLLYNRLRWNYHRHSKPKIVVKKFRKRASKTHQFDPETNQYHHDHPSQQKPQNPKNAAVYPNTQLGAQLPIRIATFNAALFSMAPAVVPNSNNFPTNDYNPNNISRFSRRVEENVKVRVINNDRPKGILKQSPLHPASVNLKSNTNNEDSLIRQQQKFAKSKLRVSINLPDNEISLGRSRRIGFVDESKTPSRCLSERNIWMNDNHDEGERLLRSKRAVVDVLRELDADILALQDVKAEEEKQMKPLSDLAAALGMNYVFAESWAPEYGNAVLSKWPIKNSKVQKIFDHTDFRLVFPYFPPYYNLAFNFFYLLLFYFET